MKVKKIIKLIFCLVYVNCFYSQSPWANASYNLHDLIIYSGSAASMRHLEKNYLGGKYDYYLKSPFISAGFDYCFANRDALWGAGLYCSSGLGKKGYTESQGDVGVFWSSCLLAVKFTHHNKFFIRQKMDLCSGYIIGTRTNNYERVYISDQRSHSTPKRTFELAAGISATLKYYPTDLIAIYIEGALGYNMDIFQIGIARRLKKSDK